MFRFLARRLLAALFVVLGVLTLEFLALHAMPGDPSDIFCTEETPAEVCAQMQKNLGLQEPLPVQYVRMMGSVGRFALSSYRDQRPVLEILVPALKNSLVLATMVLLLTYVTGIALGILQAVKQYSVLDMLATTTGLFFYSMPAFWLGLMLMLVFSSWLGWTAVSGMSDPMADLMTPPERWIDRIRHFTLPVATLWLASSASLARYMRSSMLEVIRQDYVRTARAKGVPEAWVIGRHALRNALLPIITLLGLELPYLISGAVLVENVFGWPGMGRQVVFAILQQDIPVVMTFTYVFALLVAAGALLADLLYLVADPRIRHE